MMKVLGITFLFLAALGTSAQKNEVTINHVYLAIDSATMSALNGNIFMKDELAGAEFRKTELSNSQSYTGLYLYGKNSYFEFLQDTETPIGFTGIGFGIESPRGFDNFVENVRSKTNFVEVSLQERNLGASQVKWYNSLWFMDSIIYVQDSLAYNEMPIYCWVMSYHEDYFKHKGLPISGDGRLTAASYLSQHNLIRTGKIIKDFTGMKLQLTAGELLMFEKYLIDIGGKKRRGKGKSFEINGFEIYIDVISTSAKKPLKTMIFETNKSHKKQKIDISPTISLSLHKKRGSINF
jgi:sorbitol-specific phosphotransferase system component IIA